ncbi:hypothetical protein LIER_16303 [Lithospermum erythrorhizon]|uniref:SP-RING-type domain-containing protein n=1 Tax=Lithospermum erythrorhizon TaxID=34254 RepID=A0AAV3Q8Q5_LITER
MASTGKIQSSASSLCDDNHSLIVEIRSTLNIIKDIAVDFETDNNKSQQVKELEGGVVELLEASSDCTLLSAAIQLYATHYQPKTEPTDFNKWFDEEIAKSKASSPSAPENNRLLRQFREAVWNVHHAGQPMPGDDQEDIVVTSTQCNILNVTCPLSGKPVTELAQPVRSMDCKHVYEKNVVMQYMRSARKCPVAGCPNRNLLSERVIQDQLLLLDIEELRVMSKQTARDDVIEDFTNIDDEETS